jgi:hypothetical protein
MTKSESVGKSGAGTDKLINLDGKKVLITGGTGSFGRAFVKFVTESFQPSRLIIFCRDEMKQSEMRERWNAPFLRYFIGDVRDVDRLEMAMCGVEYVVHAAALKQVPTAEYKPFECVRTNINGAEYVVRAAIKSGVRRVIALSTDKAESTFMARVSLRPTKFSSRPMLLPAPAVHVSLWSATATCSVRAVASFRYLHDSSERVPRDCRSPTSA